MLKTDDRFGGKSITRWDGTAWSLVGSTVPPGQLTDMTIYQDSLYVVTDSAYRSTSGDFEKINDMALPEIVASDGTTFALFAPQPPYFSVHELDIISPTAMLVYADA